jgi:transposase
MNIKTLGIDLAKNVFHLCGMDEPGKVILRKRLSRGSCLSL